MFKLLGAILTPPFSIFILVLSVLAALLILFLAFLAWLIFLVTGEDGPMGLSEDNIFKGPL